MSNFLLHIEVVENLPVIHSEMIQKYKTALLQPGSVSGDIKYIYECIIKESMNCIQELENKILRHDSAGMAKTATNKIAGTAADCQKNKDDVRSAHPGKKDILACCAKDELFLLSAYLKALSLDAIDTGVKRILTTQQERIMRLYGHIKKFYNAQS